MKQDAGKKVQIIATGQTVETTGQMLELRPGKWIYGIKFKNGRTEWFRNHELRYISNSK